MGRERVMIFAEFKKRQDSQGFQKLVGILEARFGETGTVRCGDQGTPSHPDAYVWVTLPDLPRVSVDNLSSLRFQVKCAARGNPLLEDVLATLSASYSLERFEEPKLEGHEGEGL